MARTLKIDEHSGSRWLRSRGHSDVKGGGVGHTIDVKREPSLGELAMQPQALENARIIRANQSTAHMHANNVTARYK